MHARHRDFHDVRGRALDWHVDRHSLGRVAHGVHAARHVRDVAAASEERFDVALLDAEGLRLEDIPAHLAVSLEVLVDEPLRFLPRHLHAPGETEVAHAVDDPEVQHLRDIRSEEHTSELQSQSNLVCRLLLEKKKKKKIYTREHKMQYENLE